MEWRDDIRGTFENSGLGAERGTSMAFSLRARPFIQSAFGGFLMGRGTILTGREWRDDIRGTVEKTAGRMSDLDLMVTFVESAGVNCLSAGCSWRRRDDGKALCH